MLRTGMGYTIEHIFPVEHAGAAMDNQIISGQVYGKVIPGDEVYLQPRRCVFVAGGEF